MPAISIAASDELSQSECVLHKLANKKYGSNDHASFIMLAQVETNRITEQAYEILMKRQVAKIVCTDIV